MKYSILNNKITFTVIDINKHAERYISLDRVNVDIQLIHKICSSMCRYGQGKSVYTQDQYTQNYIKPLMNFFRHKKISNPSSSSDWQSIILGFLSFYISDNVYSKARLSTRVQIWHTRITAFLKVLVDDGVIPIGIIIPNIKLNDEYSKTSFKETLQDSLSYKESTLDKLVIDRDFALGDNVFLDKIEERLRQKILILRNVCIEHFEAIIADNDFYKNFIDDNKYNDVNSLFTQYSGLVKKPQKKITLFIIKKTMMVTSGQY